MTFDASTTDTTQHACNFATSLHAPSRRDHLTLALSDFIF